MPTIADKKSFIIGVQVGRRLALWDTYKKLEPPFADRPILTEFERDLLTETEDALITE